MKKLVFAVVVAALAGGCAQIDVAQTAVRETGARAADEARQSAEWMLCHGITVGAWRRAYGADPVRAHGWSLLCSPPANMPLPQGPAHEPAVRNPGAATWTM